MTEDRAATILGLLRQSFTLPDWLGSNFDPFETLVETILSQNTADRNTEKAFNALSKQFQIKPEILANACLAEIEKAIKPAGLFKSKALAIKQASTIILKNYEGTLQSILSLPVEEARRALIQFPGVGPKTADVTLLFSARKATIPVDTHVNRVAKRLGFASANAGYESVRQNLQSLYEPSNYLQVHVLMIAHGRKYCKARNPVCNKCPINTFCPSKGVFSQYE